ncbi:MAG: NAD(P)-dependent oxidoreductase [Myxococcaceae bacterium]|nr:NAD(P)-dependent oxidoreductase [Myxococcaceae bacterium]
MIIVTGATGQLGHAIVERLVQLVSPHQVGASVRDVAKASGLSALRVRVRRGDFADPKSLVHAFEGATQVLIISSNARTYGGDPLGQHRSAIEAALSVGARRVVYTSHMAASASSAFPPMRDHAATEEMLRQSGMIWTALRHGFYAASGIALLSEALETGVVAAPSDGKVSWTAHSDLAEAAAIVLADENPRYAGPTPPLTAAQALDLADLARIASESKGSPVRRQVISEDELRAKMAASGVSPQGAEVMLGLYRASQRGEFAAVDPTLEQLLGRPPISMRDLIAQTFGG